MSLLPYADNTNFVRTNGSYIWQAFEHSVANYDPEKTEGPGPFLQVSGKNAENVDCFTSIEKYVEMKKLKTWNANNNISLSIQ